MVSQALSHALPLPPIEPILWAAPFALANGARGPDPCPLRLQNAAKLDSEIIYDRDFDYDYFGFKVPAPPETRPPPPAAAVPPPAPLPAPPTCLPSPASAPTPRTVARTPR